MGAQSGAASTLSTHIYSIYIYTYLQVLYEVTASGVPQNWPGFWINSNRLRDRTADTRGDGVYNR